MSRRVRPGLVFALPTDRGFAIGIYTHKHPQLGSLVWLAEGFWDEEPRISDVERMEWRWCVFFPLGAALRRQIVSYVGHAEIPTELALMPELRAGGGGQKWARVINGDLSSLEAASDPRVPIAMIVNDSRLKEMLVEDWRPENTW